MSIHIIDTDDFLGALKEMLQVRLTPEDLALFDQNKARMARLEHAFEGLDRLRDGVQIAPTEVGITKLERDESKSLAPTRLAFILREALDEFILAIDVQASKDRASIALSKFMLATLELNEIGMQLDLEGVRVSMRYSSDDKQEYLPPELMAQLTNAERAIVAQYGVTLDNSPTEEQQPYCSLSPCPGCDLRRKVNSFRALVAKERAQPH